MHHIQVLTYKLKELGEIDYSFFLHMGLQEDLRKHLALAVRSIQWSYVIFWSISPTQPGVIKWVDGYYNGDIKTRKTVQANEYSNDEWGLERSDQLRELYDSLSTEDSNQQAKRPSASLSPEDLTDMEWYYLVCMSFVFNLGQGLPGRTLASGQPIWLSNAPQADSKLFLRSLLAKSASIRTVVCFPFSGGVVELGVTEKVLEDASLIQHMQSSLLISTPILTSSLLDENLIQNDSNAIVECEEVNIFYKAGDSHMIDGLDKAASDQVESFLLMNGDDGTNDFHDSMSTSDCISQNLVDTEIISSIGILEKENEISPIIQGNEVHYQSVVSTLLMSSNKFMMGLYSRECDKGSSFIRWNEVDDFGFEMVHSGASQKLLKKVLFDVARMHNTCLIQYEEADNERKDGTKRREMHERDTYHVVAERRRRERLSERFSVLESLLPSTNKVDKVSIIDNTIEYIRELERRVEMRSRRSYQGIGEMTSDNYGQSNKNDRKRKKPLIETRKYCDSGELEVEEPNDDLNVHVIEKDVSIEIKCLWRECLLLDIMDEISKLRLDSHSVQSNNTNGMLSISVKSKFTGSTVPTRGIIKQAIQRIIQNC